VVFIYLLCFWLGKSTLVIGYARATLTLTLVLTTGLITIFILVISVIGKWSVVRVALRGSLSHQPVVAAGCPPRAVRFDKKFTRSVAGACVSPSYNRRSCTFKS
jgi:hypothetical protein